MPRISPQRYIWVARVALTMLVAIVITGSIVRLTGSGLGCVDWPACNEERFVDVSSGHAAIEQVNRLFTGLVALAVILALGSSVLMRPRSRRLVLLSVGLVVGVLAQVVIGGIVVLTGLHPSSNMVHFLVSVVLVATARLLIWEARVHADSARPQGGDQARKSWGIATYGAVIATIVAGTVVTASGPHAGDENAPRFDLDLSDVVRIHGVVAWIAGVLILIGTWKSFTEWRAIRRHVEVLIGFFLAQIFIGYLQYFSGVPSQLVAIHIAISMAVVIAATDVVWTTWRRPSINEPQRATTGR
jgi:cytochrome c oxidase assembly protein subunit 15